MKGTIINYYFICKRKCWLFYHNFNLEDNSEDVRIGKVLHKLNESKNSEILIDDVKIDKINNKYIVEFKKSDSSIDADIAQILNYLYVLDTKGINKIGKLIFFDNERQEQKEIIIELNEENKATLLKTYNDISNLLETTTVPPYNKTKDCTKCAYRDYCQI